MEDWFSACVPMPSAAAHTAFRARVQEALTNWCTAQGSLAAIQSMALVHPNRPVTPNDALKMKRLEGLAADSMRIARAEADAYHQGLAVADHVTWESLIRRAEVAVSTAMGKVQLRHAGEGAVSRLTEAEERATGSAVILLAWALCDAPIALRVMRDGQTAQEAAAW